MSSLSSVPVEIAVQDAVGARSALAAGAQRLELCQALEVGGLTPSLGLIQATCEAVDPAAVFVLVRPRPGGFVYSDEEVDVVTADIHACVSRGVGGVVVGALDAGGAVDTKVVQRWRDATGDATLVFHRAIDASRDPLESLALLVDAGVNRVLTSGGALRAIDGVETLAALSAQANARVEVMAGGGVSPTDIPALVAAGVDAVHLSARHRVGEDAPAGPGGGTSTGHDATDVALVRQAVAFASR
ncbi:copper homeostasis protein CutC [Microbacterium sp. C7(2022)]|uniref:copper homeostasis protein CutC n=1 Tax=Microbacterium sp. C7(2022) TaxID=2992759 RepID=UPI00237C3ACD|nr:copper homeostasis protein CutC [Microbacterium sp. C7(2022)]MDE0545626.1 copper homeostasis protein CutC [Microbacterium sp. C7(2022)]